MKMTLINDNYDVIVVGGSYAGLSAAMSLGRALRNVLLIDSGLPCNRHAPHSHNFLTRDGEKPGLISAKAKAQISRYPTVKFHRGKATDAKKSANGFSLTTESREEFRTKKLIFATGLKDIMPNIPGFAECWGISVIHCPYCHGYEVKKEITGILANGETAYHYAKLIRNWTEKLTLFTNGPSTLKDEQLVAILKHGIPVVEKEIDYLHHDHGHVEQIVFKDSSSVELKAIYTRPETEQHCKIPQTLGCELSDQGLIKVDVFQKTTLDHVFACGDSASPLRSVAYAVAAGNIAGAVANNDLCDSEWQQKFWKKH